MGVDNGTNTVGVVVIDHNLQTGVSDLIHAKTLTADKAAYIRHPGLASGRSKLHARLEIIKPYIADRLEEFDPDIMGVESPFVHLNVSAYDALMMSIGAMEDEAYNYRSTMDFVRISPGKAKKAVCPKGEYKNDKEWIREFIMRSPAIISSCGILISSLDEHCIDGIAVARCLALDAARAFT